MTEPDGIVGVDKWRESKQELLALVRRAADDDESVLPALREMLGERPDIWKIFAEQAETTRDIAISQATADGSMLSIESTKFYLDEMKQGLVGSAPQPLESLVADRICLCWLQVNKAEARYWAADKTGDTKRIEFAQRRLERAQRQYMGALKTLAQISRMRLPDVQINIADHQTNIGNRQLNCRS